MGLGVGAGAHLRGVDRELLGDDEHRLGELGDGLVRAGVRVRIGVRVKGEG